MSENDVWKYTLPDGQVVVLHKLTVNDFNVLCDWTRSKYMFDYLSSMFAVSLIGRDECFRLISDLLKYVNGSDFMSDSGIHILQESSDGVARVVYQMISNPAIAFTDFLHLLFPGSPFLKIDFEKFMNGYKIVSEMIDQVYKTSIDKVLSEQC